MIWERLQQPKVLDFDDDTLSDVYGQFIVEPLERGMGTTIGNSLRRILLSSIEGSCITSVKFEDVLHQFTNIDGVLEDVYNIVLNIKGVVVRKNSNEEKILQLDAFGEGEVKASDIILDPDVEIINPDHHIATLTGDGKLKCEMVVQSGYGYITLENIEKDESEVGMIYLDANYSPIRKVSFNVQKTRVGRRTDYDKLILEITTNGSINPSDALKEASDILYQHLELIRDYDQLLQRDIEEELREKERIAELLSKNVSDFELSVRAANCLKKAGIEKIGDLVQKTEQEMLGYKNFGQKSLKEIINLLSSMGLSLGMEIDEETGEIIGE